MLGIGRIVAALGAGKAAPPEALALFTKVSPPARNEPAKPVGKAASVSANRRASASVRPAPGRTVGGRHETLQHYGGSGKTPGP